MSTPRIGITGRLAMVERAERAGVNGAYVRAVLAAGGAPLILPPVAGPALASVLLDGVDALLLSGGADVHPRHYRAQPHPKLGAVEEERDASELALFAEAVRRELPVLAICRGLQLVNVALGGSLWQDLPSELVAHPQSGARTERIHPVEVAAGSRLADALGATHSGVNSFHHQAIRELAPGLRASAHAPDGVIEGIEGTGDHWLLGVQWHPEEFWADAAAPEAGLFRAFVSASEEAGR
ncbi:MAG TPA: gamma-glutamyl-gamma-aminobutyrate hydrolase family protein [Gemmatimonadales bacterium]|nr:gamma-glutamyl-gamma-aminobutyrate hydrolase family protein [Gemmatimonadales bacterium]